MPITDLFKNGNRPNLVFIITDQERRLQHWPSFLTRLPAMRQLMSTGLTFNRAFTAASMCSPSRSAFITSNYPAVTRVTTTGSPEPPISLPPPTVLPNLATVLTRAGYATCEWRGKWHLGGSPNDYGFSGWDSPDAGNTIRNFDTLGGGTPDNDQRFLDDILHFLGNSPESPFCLIASFVNPHDVFVGQFGPAGSGYTTADFSKVVVPLPPNADEDLSTKPRAQANMSWKNVGVGLSNTQQDYVNFYAYLQTMVDAQIAQVLSALGGVLDNTLIVRFADHGEMALSHSLVEKFYNGYEETINVPLIFSNPIAWPTAQSSDSLVSLIDLIPTLASLLGVGGDFTGFQGRDLTPVLLNPGAAVQDAVHFTYDDIPTSFGPSIIRSIRTVGHAYSVYFAADGSDADWELYDLEADPLQNNNVAGTQAYGAIQQQLDSRLQQLTTAHGTMPSFTWPPSQTADSRGGPPAVGPNVRLAALADEIRNLAGGGAGSVGRLSAILYAPGTPPHIVVHAARALVSLGTPEAFAALQPALYEPWPHSVLAKVHEAYALRA